jgi:hypothetical protein
MPAARSISPLRLGRSGDLGFAGDPSDVGVRKRPNRPAFEAEARARARSHVPIVPPVWRQCAGAQRLLTTTASLDRHQGSRPVMLDRPTR